MKLLVSDLDGTLLGKDKLVRPQIVEAIARWQAAGNQFVIATGRLYSSTLYYADQFLAPDYIIGCSGATVYRGADLIIDQPIDVRLVHKLWDYMNQTGGYCQVYSDKQLIANRVGRIVETYRQYATRFGEKYAIPITIEPDSRKLNVPIHKLSFVFDDDRQAEAVLAELGDLSGHNLFRSLPFLFDIISDKADKGLAARQLQAMLGANELFAIGDNENDMAMLLAADYSAAIETAPDHVKQTADTIVAIPDVDGMAQFIDELLAR